ncbi:hypothetical protein LTR17_006920 [Elasticomyces elasticus]|nr:hypothetical protein LTR17_006920 [Elasticomyces elasticus]
MDDTLRRYSKTWIDANLGYRYELSADETARTYVKDKYAGRTDIIQLFDNMQEPVLSADYIRYLTLVAEGGVYGDVDAECSRPAEDWIPAEHRNLTGLFVGIEYGARHEEIRGDIDSKVRLCQWIFASRPGNSALRYVVDRVTQALLLPRPLEVVGKQIGREIVDEDIMNLTGPKLIGDVLVMPINAFGTGQFHSGSGPWGNAGQLISHHFTGFLTWKHSHEMAGTPWERKSNQ